MWLLVTSVWSEVLIRHLAVQFLEGSTQRQPRTGALVCRGFQKPYSETNSENKNPVFRHRNFCALSKQIQTLSKRKWNSENLPPLQAKKNLLRFLTVSSQARVSSRLCPAGFSSVPPAAPPVSPDKLLRKRVQRLNIWRIGNGQTWRRYWNPVVLKGTEKRPSKGRSELS